MTDLSRSFLRQDDLSLTFVLWCSHAFYDKSLSQEVSGDALVDVNISTTR